MIVLEDTEKLKKKNWFKGLVVCVATLSFSQCMHMLRKGTV